MSELLSILVPCSPSRWPPEWLFVRPSIIDVQFYPCLTPLHEDGGPTIGEKRDWLVQMAKGKYLTFWDDDDTRDLANWWEDFVNAAKDNPDVICGWSRFKDTVIYHDLSHMRNPQPYGKKSIMRPPWHVCFYKTEIAQKYRFPHKNYGEDWPWCKKVNAECKTQRKIKKIIYTYQWDAGKSLAKL